MTTLWKVEENKMIEEVEESTGKVGGKTKSSLAKAAVAGKIDGPGNLALQTRRSNHYHRDQHYSKESRRHSSAVVMQQKNKSSFVVERRPHSTSPHPPGSRSSSRTQASRSGRSSAPSSQRGRNHLGSKNQEREMSKSSNWYRSRRRSRSDDESRRRRSSATKSSLSRSNHDGSGRRNPSVSTFKSRYRSNDGSSQNTKSPLMIRDSSGRINDEVKHQTMDRNSSSPLRRATTTEVYTKRSDSPAIPLRRVQTEAHNRGAEMEGSSSRHQGIPKKNPSGYNTKKQVQRERSKSPKQSSYPSSKSEKNGNKPKDRTSPDGSEDSSVGGHHHHKSASPDSRALKSTMTDEDKRLWTIGATEAGKEYPAKPGSTSLQRALSEGHQRSSPMLRQQRASEGHVRMSPPRRQRRSDPSPTRQPQRVSKGSHRPSQQEGTSTDGSATSAKKERCHKKSPSSHSSAHQAKTDEKKLWDAATAAFQRHQHKEDVCAAKMREDDTEKGHKNKSASRTYKCRSQRHQNAHANSVLHAQLEHGVELQDKVLEEEWVAQQEFKQEEIEHVEEDKKEEIELDQSSGSILGRSMSNLLNAPMAAATMAPKFVTGTAIVAAKTTVAATKAVGSGTLATASTAAQFAGKTTVTATQAVGSGALATASTAAHFAGKTTVAATGTASAAASITAQAVGSSALATASTAAHVITGAANVALQLVPFSSSTEHQYERHESTNSHKADEERLALIGDGELGRGSSD